MKMCSNCSFENQNPAQYCQHCGTLLATKKSFFHRAKKRKDGDNNIREKVHQAHTLEDGGWFCPYCGEKNKGTQFTCGKCLEDRP